MASLKSWTYSIDIELIHRDRKWNWAQYEFCPRVKGEPVLNGQPIFAQETVLHTPSPGSILLDDVDGDSLIRAVKAACGSTSPVVWRSLDPTFAIVFSPPGSVELLEPGFRDRHHWDPVAVTVLLDSYNHVEDYSGDLDMGVGLLLYVKSSDLLEFSESLSLEYDGISETLPPVEDDPRLGRLQIPDSSNIEIDYRLTGVGCSECKVTASGKSVTVAASYLNDALLSLAEAVMAIAAGDNNTSAEFMEEPGVHVWRFTRTGADVHVLIEWHKDWFLDQRDSTECEIAFECTCSVTTLVRATVLSMAEVLRVHGFRGYAKEWIDGLFPMYTFNSLRLALRNLLDRT